MPTKKKIKIVIIKKITVKCKQEEFTKSLPYIAVKISLQFVFVPACAEA